MATPTEAKEASPPQFENRLRERRQSVGLSQKQLADMAGITRQAVGAVEANQYSPATSVALQLARALKCRVEDLFSIKSTGEIVEGELLGAPQKGSERIRAQVTQIGDRWLVRPLDGIDELTSLTASADGLIVDADPKSARVKVRLLKDRETVRRQVVLGGCDPAMFLAAEHLRKHDKEHLVPCMMGNSLALAALKRGEVHAAGVHLVDGAWNLPHLRRVLGGLDCTVITFAHWEEGIIVRQGNPKRIRAVADLAHPGVRMINREKGSGARRLLDRELKSAGIPSARVKGYGDEVFSHLEVASRVKSGLAQAGIGVRAAAAICGLDFIPLQRERYDLVIPKTYYESLPGLRTLLDLIAGKPFREELEALGGYDTRETGKVVESAPNTMTPPAEHH
ncbi:MAG: substrate-binding domain-containing protein [Candidatus Binatia bacterium]